jgi:paraquat-inducible protein A
VNALSTVACPDCDLLQHTPPFGSASRLACLRCGRVLAKQVSGSRDRTLALTLTAGIALVVANALPLMELRVAGRSTSTTIIGGADQLWLQGERITAVLVAFCAAVAPAGYLLLMAAILLAARREPTPRWAGEVVRWMQHLQVWSMLEVVLLGILVALVKIAQLATVDPGIGIYAFGAVVILIPAIAVSFDAGTFWQGVRWADGTLPPRLPSETARSAAK